jgi:hypothetical protein
MSDVPVGREFFVVMMMVMMMMMMMVPQLAGHGR